MWERPRTNGKSTSGRSRVRYAPCPVNSSTGYTQPVDAGKGDLLYPVPDPTIGGLPSQHQPVGCIPRPADAGKGDLLYPVPDPMPGVEVHGSSRGKGPGVVERLQPDRPWVL